MRIFKTKGMTAIGVAIVCALAATSLNAKERGGKRDGDPFDETGTVTKNDVDNCMQGNVTFRLHSAKQVDRLSPKSRADIKVLGDAVKNGRKVHVVGNWKSGVRPDCDYVITKKCEPVNGGHHGE